MEPDSPSRRRIGVPGLIVLIVVLAGAFAAVIWMNERARVPGEPEGPFVGAIEPSDEDPDWRHHAWTTDGGPGGARPADPTGRDAVYDPQRSAMRESLGEGGDAGAGFAPIERAARIVDTEGALSVARDAACEVRVLPVRHDGWDCLVRVLCAGAVLYPNESQTNGYLRCRYGEGGAPLGASDPDPSAADGDPTLALDLAAGRVEVSDEGRRAYRVVLRLR